MGTKMAGIRVANKELNSHIKDNAPYHSIHDPDIQMCKLYCMCETVCIWARWLLYGNKALMMILRVFTSSGITLV